jgi:hypothetical protein
LETVMQLFVDMDGVIADFAQHHQAVVGWRPDQEDDVDWAVVREVEDFYLNIPPMADLQLLWDRIERYQPIVLTGVPEEIAEAPANKRAWVSKHLGPEVQVRCCQASEKWMHAQRGDILIDDSVKHRKRWVKAGGIWVTHRGAEGTAAILDLMGV